MTAEIQLSILMGNYPVRMSMMCRRNCARDKAALFSIDRNKNSVYSDDENKLNNAAPVPKSSETRNILKGMRSYLDTHSNSETNPKMVNIEQFVDI
ncbi:hypothetical protein TNCV_2558281 [Trichonephila clavipes]|nr:hypothetical protein TNCV_2558281 [Trichonephila clavipes]